ncbi:MAG: hypothetical protein FWD39_06070 [Clostridiales bacterium]|nr:hypothetical protein [Clostridiales bacterium]
MKRKIFLLLVCLTILAMLSGCQGNELVEITITYAPKTVGGEDGAGGTVSVSSETVNPETGRPKSIAEAKPGYEFVGWYAASDTGYLSLLSSDEAFNPALEAGSYVALFRSELQTGKYIKEGNPAWVVLHDDDTFLFIRPAANYAPAGTYSIEKDKLILFVSDYENYIFLIRDGQIIFDSSLPSGVALIDKGTVFKFDTETT